MSTPEQRVKMGAISVLPDDMKEGAVPFDRIEGLLVRYNFDHRPLGI
jgi:hypothetical protein